MTAISEITHEVEQQIRWFVTDGNVQYSDVARAFGVPTDLVVAVAEGRSFVVSGNQPARTAEGVSATALALLRLLESPPPFIGTEGSITAPLHSYSHSLVLDLCDPAHVFLDAEPSDLPAHADVRVSILTLGGLDSDFVAQAEALRTTTRKAARGRIDQRFAMLPWIFDRSLLSIWKTGRGVSIRKCVGFGNGRWTDAEVKRFSGGDAGIAPTSIGDDFFRVEEVPNLRRLVGVHVTDQYQWSVSLMLKQGHMSTRFWVSPAGIRDLFRLRDLPEGAKRRAALLHWVSGHWRRKSDGDDAAWVRRHLRGKTDFAWGDMFGRVVPSRDALEQIKKEKLP